MTATKDANLFKLKISSVPESISRVESFIEEIRSKINITDEVYGNILVAMTEAVNNAIFHGNKCNPQKMVNMEMEQKGGTLRFSVKDDGVGFDYDSLPDPTAPENLERPTGRGVFLMRQLSDSISFLDEGKVVQMQFNIK